jgi:hypothetical protein
LIVDCFGSGVVVKNDVVKKEDAVILSKEKYLCTPRPVAKVIRGKGRRSG